MIDTAQAQDLVNSATWYHGWEIVPGVRTPGICKIDPKQLLDLYGVPADLTGMRALDIGTWDGAYSFELERRGAEVVSLDIQDPNENGYNTAKKILGSKCVHAQFSVYDLVDKPAIITRTEYDTQNVDFHSLGHQFDLILYMGVFYHLKEPMRAWEAIKSVMKPDTKMYFEGLVFDYAWKSDIRLRHRQEQIEAMRDLPFAYFAAEEYGYDPENWYIPTVTCLYGWLVTAGYDVLSMATIENTSRACGVAKVRS